MLAVTDNPWLPDQWNVTHQGEYVTRFGELLARARAAEASSFLGATRPAAEKPRPKVEHHTRIVNKTFISGGGGVGAGSSGDGPPN